jgi:general secretion pathway protein D
VPIQSFDYRPIGIIVKMKPRVTFENEVVLDISVENSTLLGNLTVAGQDLPSFGSRKVKTRMRLREGESNLLAGLLREDERSTLTGFPGLLRVPILKELFGNTNDEIRTTDVVMLLTPRIVRTHELTQEHLNPIHIGSASNIGLTGPAPVIAAPPVEEVAPAPGAVGPQPPPPAGIQPGGIPPAPQPVPPVGTTSTPGLPPSPQAPPTSTPGQQPAPGAVNPYPQTPQSPAATPYNPTQVPAGATGPGAPAGAGSRPAGTPPASTPPPEAPPAAGTPPGTPPRDAAPAGKPVPQAAGQQAAPAQIVVTTPGPEFRVGGGPYTVPISVTAGSRISVTSLSLTYNPAVLRVRNVQQGPFMSQGGITAQFSQKAEPGSGRVDITITRTGDSTGASGTGLLAAVLFDAIAPGGSTLSVSGVATGPDGASVPLGFVPATITAR